VVQAQDLVVHQALDEIESAPSGDHPGNERPGPAVLVPSAIGGDEDEHADDRDDPRDGMEQPVRERVDLEVRDGVRRRA
jgi:hypothetical protein